MPRWARILLIVVAIVVGLLALLAGAGWWALSHPGAVTEKLGGDWELSKPNSLTIGSGSPPDYLQRVHGKTRITIAVRPRPFRYIGDDCMLFTVWIHGDYEVRAACGDRPPILVTRVERSVSSQDLERDPATINGIAYSWADIKQHALLGQPY